MLEDNKVKTIVIFSLNVAGLGQSPVTWYPCVSWRSIISALLCHRRITISWNGSVPPWEMQLSNANLASPLQRAKPLRRTFAVSGDELVLAFVKAKKNPTTKKINAHWKSRGRAYSADNTLTISLPSTDSLPLDVIASVPKVTFAR